MFFFFIFVSASFCFFKIDADSSMVVDEFDRQVLFHGVNAVVKVPPFYPDYTGSWNANITMNEEDATNLKNWGFNFVRLFVGWEATETSEGVFSTEYLENVENIVNLLGKHGIFALLDMHQDVASPFTCGEGIPDFYIQKDTKLPFPDPFPWDIPIDPETGYRNKKACLEHGFAMYYPTVQVSEIFQDLYTPLSKMREGWKNFWRFVSTHFQKNEYVVGYELINEPWFGDVWKDLKLFESGKSDKENLFPLYQEVYEESIYPNDRNHIVFFESSVMDLYRTGFESSPFGNDAENITRTMFSWHMYCGITDKEGDPKIRVLCDAIDDYFVETRVLDAKAIGGGSFCTEFGASGNASASIETIQWQLRELEKRMIHWSYWQYKYYGDYTTQDQPASTESFYDTKGNLQSGKVKALSRTYAPYTCGRGIESSFDSTTTKNEWIYSFSFKDCQKQGTIVFLNEDYYYSNGYNIEIQPKGAMTATKTEHNYLLLNEADWVKEGDVITITITQK